MKRKTLSILVLVLASMFALNVQAQEESSWSTGVDLYSTYVFRGIAFSGPSLQPYVDYTSGGFSIGAWGSQGYDGFQEMDLYLSYGFDFGLSVGLTDYYYPGTEFFDTSTETGAHAFEVNLGFETGALSLAGNYILNEAGGAASAGGDVYFEAGVAVGNVDLFLGAGDGWHTSDGEFNVCNVGIGTSKEIKITDSFSIPVSGAAILNPDTEQFYIVVGISL
ncbi:TorF family putative porin [uncultured Sunxiuqinia sp.]|uniref:TorF family putative porin n=1 Tax=uncultured Sunxiuqinia sp. TaxID=1573825 RepID=UPI0030D8DCD6|tara:strand:+ start:28321 stop:28983 length:663 start_codon:yes stop_codon:yes gene_type:complete